MPTQQYINMLISKLQRIQCSGTTCHCKNNLLMMLKSNPSDKTIKRAEQLLMKIASRLF